MSSLAVGTIVAGNFLSFARVLASSFRRFHAGVPLYVLVLDEALPATEEFHVVSPAELEAPELKQILFSLGRKGAAAALSPALLSYLLRQGYDAALFLDPDMLVMGDLSPEFNIVGSHSLTLTPHLGPAPDSPERQARERQILLAGTFNAGFIGVAQAAETLRFLDWWARRLSSHCLEDLAGGLHYDQRWLDLATGFVEDLFVLRDPGINTAYWNLPDRRVETDGERLVVDGCPCRLFHFSGFDPAYPDRASRFAPGLSPSSLGVGPLFERYAALLLDAGHNACRNRPWPWARYANGDEVTSVERHLYLALDASTRAAFGDPFATGPGTFHDWVRRPHRRLVRFARALAGRGLRFALRYARWRPGPPFAP